MHVCNPGMPFYEGQKNVKKKHWTNLSRSRRCTIKMKIQLKHPVRAIILAALLSFTYAASAFYDPHIGRWLSRDPIEEGGGKFLYGFVLNSPIVVFDTDGRQITPSITNMSAWQIPEQTPGVTWTPSCPKGMKGPTFIQIVWGGWGPYKNARVDFGTAGFASSPKDPPFYPETTGIPNTMSDDPGGPTGPIQFETCMVCEYCTMIVGPCRRWKKGDNGDLNNFPGTDTPSQLFIDALKREFPDFEYWYKGKH